MKRSIFCPVTAVILACTLLCGCDSSQYSVNLDGNYSGSSAQTITSGKKLNVTENPTRDGYNFIGWFKDKNLSEKWDEGKDKIPSDVTLYDGWDKNSGGSITTS